MRAAGMPDGRYALAALDVEVRDGCARLANGALAGSLLTMDAAVRTMVREAGLPLDLVLPLASEVAARALGIDGRRSEERRVGKEWRSRRWRDHENKSE